MRRINLFAYLNILVIFCLLQACASQGGSGTGEGFNGGSSAATFEEVLNPENQDAGEAGLQPMDPLQQEPLDISEQGPPNPESGGNTPGGLQGEVAILNPNLAGNLSAGVQKLNPTLSLEEFCQKNFDECEKNAGDDPIAIGVCSDQFAECNHPDNCNSKFALCIQNGKPYPQCNYDFKRCPFVIECQAEKEECVSDPNEYSGECIPKYNNCINAIDGKI